MKTEIELSDEHKTEAGCNIMVYPGGFLQELRKAYSHVMPLVLQKSSLHPNENYLLSPFLCKNSALEGVKL